MEAAMTRHHHGKGVAYCSECDLPRRLSTRKVLREAHEVMKHLRPFYFKGFLMRLGLTK